MRGPKKSPSPQSPLSSGLGLGLRWVSSPKKYYIKQESKIKSSDPDGPDDPDKPNDLDGLDNPNVPDDQDRSDDKDRPDNQDWPDDQDKHND